MAIMPMVRAAPMLAAVSSDEQALVGRNDDPSRGNEVDAGIRFRDAKTGGVHYDVCQVARPFRWRSCSRRVVPLETRAVGVTSRARVSKSTTSGSTAGYVNHVRGRKGLLGPGEDPQSGTTDTDRASGYALAA